MEWCILFIINYLVCQNSALQCLNENGKIVDWWFIYKINNGLSYTYYDATTKHVHSLPVVYNKLLSDKNTALAHTLSRIWKKPNSHNFIAYNDDRPDADNSLSFGHTKGVFTYNSHQSNGYYLIHSWPQFPNLSGNTYNVNGLSNTYAQTFLCISYKSFNTMNSIAYQIRYNKPQVYASSNKFKKVNNFTEILRAQWLKNMSTFSFETSNNAQYFTHFAKSGSAKWNNGLYEYVAYHYKQSFIWETWRRESSEPTFCQPQYEYDAINVESVTLNKQISWKYTQDHSKIGIALNIKTKPIICVGDINRMYSQYKRGGGTACFSHAKLWRLLHHAFADYDACNGTGIYYVCCDNNISYENVWKAKRYGCKNWTHGKCKFDDKNRLDGGGLIIIIVVICIILAVVIFVLGFIYYETCKRKKISFREYELMETEINKL
eukprot:425592_1